MLLPLHIILLGTSLTRMLWVGRLTCRLPIRWRLIRITRLLIWRLIRVTRLLVRRLLRCTICPLVIAGAVLTLSWITLCRLITRRRIAHTYSGLLLVQDRTNQKTY